MKRNRHLKVIFYIVLIFFAFIQSSLGEIRNTPGVISLSPHITEIIFKIEAGSYLIGRTDFCTYPREALQIESVGGYLNIDFEKIVRLDPDVIFQFPNAENRRKLESLGFKVVEIANETIEEILDGIIKVGTTLQKLPQAQEVCNNIQDTLNLVTKIHKNQETTISAILVVGRQQGSLANIYLAGNATYLSELWGICGGENTFKDVEMRYFSVNEEDLLKRKIDVILEFHPGWPNTTEETNKHKRNWDVLSSLQAVVRDKIFIFTDRYFVIPGPRITKIAISFSRIIQAYDGDGP